MGTGPPGGWRAPGRERLRSAAEGFMLGALSGFALAELGIFDLFHCNDVFLGAAIAGAILAALGARRAVRGSAIVGVLCLGIAAYTPLAAALIAGISRSDPLPPSSPAVVVLSSNSQTDGSLSSASQARMIEAYRLLRQGRSRQLVLTNADIPHGSQVPACRRQMRELGFAFPITETGPVRDTHDEASAVAAIARRMNWPYVILVTHPWHMRRAAAVFARAGVKVVCAPCAEGEYDHLDLSPEDRLRAFRHWVHEMVGYAVYRRRGWI